MHRGAISPMDDNGISKNGNQRGVCVVREGRLARGGAGVALVVGSTIVLISGRRGVFLVARTVGGAAAASATVPPGLAAVCTSRSRSQSGTGFVRDHRGVAGCAFQPQRGGCRLERTTRKEIVPESVVVVVVVMLLLGNRRGLIRGRVFFVVRLLWAHHGDLGIAGNCVLQDLEGAREGFDGLVVVPAGDLAGDVVDLLRGMHGVCVCVCVYHGQAAKGKAIPLGERTARAGTIAIESQCFRLHRRQSRRRSAIASLPVLRPDAGPL
mmetsp:Transcript_3655/g.10344  ORF Transcript_3655/g.10344 Transcript_3655/m.10344 type:complete len:267 (-) Transcript_3655:706-1506(-)